MVACETYGTVGVEGKARRGLEGGLPRARTVVAFAVCLSGLAMLLTYQVTDEIWWRSRLCALNTIASAAASAKGLAATMHFECLFLLPCPGKSPPAAGDQLAAVCSQCRGVRGGEGFSPKLPRAHPKLTIDTR